MVVLRKIINPMTGEVIPRERIYTVYDTVICYGLEQEEIECVKQIVEKHKLKIYDTDCVTDLIALPWLVAIVNPEEISSEELKGLLGFLDEIDGDFCVIFSSTPNVSIPGNVKKHMTVLGDILTNRTALEDKIVQLKEKARKEKRRSRRKNPGCCGS
jgi:hypothetical protein